MQFGALSSKYDYRDYKIKDVTSMFAKEFKLQKLPIVKNQGHICSCVAFAASSIVEYFYRKEHNLYELMSTDFIYANQYTVSKHKTPGMYLRDACKILIKYGDCKKSSLPSNTEMPDAINKLSTLTEEDKKDALNQRIKYYARCYSKNAMKFALIKYGPLLGSIKYYQDMKTDENGVIYRNAKNANNKYGLHAIMIYGWNEIGWLCQNSWGTNWGNKGHFVMPYELGIKECWAFVDMIDDDVKVPKNNYIFNIYNTVRKIFK